MIQRLIECVPNFSEGRNMQIIKQITDEIEKIASETHNSSFIIHNSSIKNHPWSGITRFKTGFVNQNFNGENFLHYPDAYDIIYQRGMYWIYKLVKKLKQ